MVEAIRWSRSHDHQVLEALFDEALAALLAQRGGGWALEEVASSLGASDVEITPASLLEATLAAAEVKVAVATLDEVVVGMGASRLDGAVGEILGCYVEPAARGVGCGQGLLGFLVASLRNEGVTRIDAMALPGDRHTKQLLESGGLKARRITMSVELR